ncbi:MAG: penicillin-binding protein 2 [Campylobacterales bacterium]|nr:penicillin-binding protein 2 [Campylobacterales bacterium]
MRMKVLLSIFILVWISLLVRIYYISIQSNNYYETLASRNTIKFEYIPPIRGEILDRNNQPLAINKLGFMLQIAPHLSAADGSLQKELETVVSVFPFMSLEELKKSYIKKDSYYNHHDITVVDFITYEDAIPVYSKINLNENIKLLPSPKRYYPNGKLAAHVIGYVAKANKRDFEDNLVAKLTSTTGKSGLEKYYNEFLQGEAGEREIKVSAYNEEMEQLSFTPPKEYQKLVLSLDLRMQTHLEKLFKDISGAVVIMDVNGEIVAAGSYPEYDLNTFVSGISTSRWSELILDLDKPFTNKLVHGLYPPGSIIKPGLGLAYVSTTKMSPWTKFDCEGSMTLGKNDRKFRCWKHDGHKETDLIQAIRESCDIYFYKGSLRVGIAEMSEQFKSFGLGKKTGVDLPNEYFGTVPDPEWKMQKYGKPWYIGETLNSSIGQGDFLTTPMQMAQFTALLAIGKLPRPHFAKMIGDKEYVPVFDDVFNDTQKKLLPIIQRSMREVCSHPKGTATHYLSTKVPIAGKTGTAQVVGIPQETIKRLKEHELAYVKRSHAWLTTYGPYKNPQYVVTVLIEHGGHGGQAAGPIVSSIYDKLSELGYIK